MLVLGLKLAASDYCRSTGFIDADPVFYQRHLKRSKRKKGALLCYFSWAESLPEAIFPVGDQGHCGSC